MLALDPPLRDTSVRITTRPWSLPAKIIFRFCVAYFGLYVLLTQMLSGLLVLPVGQVPQFGDMKWMTAPVAWVARHVFGVTKPLVITGSGSGDKTFDWVQSFTMLVLATGIVAVWSVLDRRREHYVRLHKWFHLFVRFALGTTLASYGSFKLVPLQMSFPGLTRLLEPYGNFSPMGVLWASIGASRSYEVFTGAAEMFAAILLFIPRTQVLGALVSLAVTFQVFTLNMTYDVPVKLFSFHLVLMSLFLLAPEGRRLLNVLVLDRPAMPSAMPPLGRTARAIRIGVIAQIVFGLYVAGMDVNSARQSWTTFGGGSPKSPLYGVWNIERMWIDGVERSPLVTDYDRWRRLLFDGPTRMSYQRMDDTFGGFSSKIDMAAKSITLTKPADAAWKAELAFQRPAEDRLLVDGTIDGRKLRFQMQLFDPKKFLLVSRGFNWVQEYPFNR